MTTSDLWLEDLESADSLAWVEKQNAFTLNELKAFPDYQKFYQESLNLHSSHSRLPVRSIFAGWAYDLETTEANPLGIWRRTPVENLQEDEPVWEDLIDFDQLSKSLNEEWNYGGTTLSPSGKRALVALSHRGGDRHWVREWDIVKKSFVSHGFEIPLSKSIYEWWDEDSIVVGGEEPFTTNAMGYSRVLRLWTRSSMEKRILLEGADSEFGCWIMNRGPGDDFLLFTRSRTWDIWEIHQFDEKRGLRRIYVPPVIREIFRYQDYFVFYMTQENRGCPAGSIVAVDREDSFNLQEPPLQVVWRPNEKQAGAGCLAIREGVVIVYYENVRTRFSLLELRQNQWQLSPQKMSDEIEISTFLVDKKNQELFLRTESFTTPPALMRWRQGQMEKLFSLRPQFSGEYQTRQEWAKSKDGVMIPYFVVGASEASPGPTILHGYGGFLTAETPRYVPLIGKLWLEKGGTYVLANIRGGGEFGPEWHLAARKENKQKSYDDFIAIAEDLLAKGITSRQNLALMGRSNGGLLVGAVAMQRPELFAAVLCGVPLLDMIRYTLLPPGASWMDEYGDPEDPRLREIILKYSPYQNVKEGTNYPKIFFRTSRTDDRVHPSHARRMAARMQRMGKPCLFYEESSGGHGGGNQYVKAQDSALEYSYLWKYTGQKQLET